MSSTYFLQLLLIDDKLFGNKSVKLSFFNSSFGGRLSPFESSGLLEDSEASVLEAELEISLDSLLALLVLSELELEQPLTHKMEIIDKKNKDFFIITPLYQL